MNVHFDTLDYANTLEAAGIQRPHAHAIAKVQAKALQDLVENELVTKDFLRGELTELRLELEGKIAATETRLEGRILASETKLDGKITSLESRMDAKFAELEFRLRDDFRKDFDSLRVQLRSLQYGGAIAAFAVSAAIMLSRLIR